MIKIIKSTFTVGSFTLISRILGYIRDIFIAKYMGASSVNDAFLVAFRLPNFFRQLFAEGALNAAFIPMFSQILNSQGKEAALDFASKVISAIIYLIIIIIILLEIFMPQVMILLAPGFTEQAEIFNHAILLARIMFPYLLFISIVAILTGILNANGKFAAGASAPIFLNLTMVITLIFWGKSLPSYSLAIGVFVAGVIQLLWLLLNIKSNNYSLSLRKISFKDSTLSILFKKMLPGIIGAGIIQFNLWVGTIISTTIPKATSYLYFADRIHQFPLALIATAIGVVLLPTLSKQYKQNDKLQAIDTVNKSLEFTLLITIPASLALFAISYPIMNVLFVRGEFTSYEALQSAYALSAYSLGLSAYSIIKIFTSIFFANNNTKTPVKIASICVVINIITNLILMQFFGHIGIATASSITAWTQLIFLYIYLKKHNYYSWDKSLSLSIIKIVLISIFMFITLYIVYYFTNFFLDSSQLVKFAYLLSLVIFGVMIYIISGIIFKIFSIKYLRKFLSNP